ncbi:hypothetical protein [Desulfovirgula thermocuniculi]|nr:hypothetical protein [Desulfovirgula thermocuniculi]
MAQEAPKIVDNFFILAFFHDLHLGSMARPGKETGNMAVKLSDRLSLF